MVVRGWGAAVAAAVGVAAAAGAAQLGLGYGLGIISWLPTASGLPDEAWIASLTWSCWVAATSTVAGVITADRITTDRITAASTGGPAPGEPPAVADTGAEPPEPPRAVRTDRITGALRRLTLAVAAAVGALVTVALVAVPARAAERADTFSPQTTAAGYAVLGVAVGLALAVAALAARAVAANMIATVSWLWLLAVVAVIDGVAAGGDPDRVPLAFWGFTTAGPMFRNIFLPDAGLALGAAMVIGVLAALPAARRGDNLIGVVMSGAVGPLTVATAYLLAQPSLVGASAKELSPHLVAPYAVLAGLAGSLLIATVRPRAPQPVEDESTGRHETVSTAEPAAASA